MKKIYLLSLSFTVLIQVWKLVLILGLKLFQGKFKSIFVVTNGNILKSFDLVNHLFALVQSSILEHFYLIFLSYFFFFLFYFILVFVCFSHPTSPPQSPIRKVPCEPSYTLSSLHFRGWPTEFCYISLYKIIATS